MKKPQENNRSGFWSWFLHERAIVFYVLLAIVFKGFFLYLDFYFPQTRLFAILKSEDIVSLINQERAEYDLPPLKTNGNLNQTAALKAQDMAQKQYFAHQSPEGISPWYWFEKAGYDYKLAGENLAVNFADSEALVSAWMQSPSHRANILNPSFQEAGLALASGLYEGYQTTFCVLSLGLSADKASEPEVKVAQKEETQPAPAVQKPAPPIKQPETIQEAKPEEQPLVPVNENKEEAVSGEKTTPEQTEIAQNNSSESKNKSAPTTAETVKEASLVPVPRILGAFTSKTDEIIKSVYICFLTLILAALVLNLLVKSRREDALSIILAIVILGLNIGLLYI